MNGQLMRLIEQEIPLNIVDAYDACGKRVGLVIIDEVDGFCTPGKGNLAPLAGAPMPPMIRRMATRTDDLARSFCSCELPILILRDSHKKGVPEPPYPEHCVEGTGEELLVPYLRWLNVYNGAMHLRKDCIDGFVSGIRESVGRNSVVHWVNAESVETLAVVGICTDICVADFVCSMLSARNHILSDSRSKLMPKLQDVVVCAPACSTYDLPHEAALAVGLPTHAAHPAELMHHMGLYMMASRGAILANSIVL